MKPDIYKKLTYSLSYTLPILVVSGVLFSIGFLFDPPFGSFLLDVSDYAFYLSYAVLAAAIAYAIGDRVAIIPALIGGFLLKDGTVGLLGAVIIGFFVGYLTKAFINVFSGIPRLISGIFPTFIYPVLITAMTLGLAYLMNQFLSDWLYNGYMLLFYDHQWLVFGFSVVLAALMAFDLGGPINKAAYLIAIMTLANGKSSTVMAAVIAGGMVPPLAVSIIQMLTKKEEGAKWWMTGILGLCFMSEGAIGFVEKDKKTIRPIMMIGSGLTGGAVAWFELATRIPHGGIFMILFMSKWYLFLLALLIGIAIILILLVLFRPKIKANIERKKTAESSLQV